MTTLKLSILSASLLIVGLLGASPAFAEASALPAKSQAQSSAVQSVQPKVDAKAAEAAAEKRRMLATEAATALDETKQALKFLEERKSGEALKALATATGKLELIVAREPKLAYAPVDVRVTTHDLFANLETTKAVIKAAKLYVSDGEFQKARPFVNALASEIVISTSNVPLATYPAAIKAVTPLIDAGKIDEAKSALQVALNTLVVTDEVIPLPTLRAEALLKAGEKLAEKKDRTETDNDTLSKLLAGAREQMKLAEILGYGNRKTFKPIYEEIEKIEKQSAGGKNGNGWFDKIKQQLSDLMK